MAGPSSPIGVATTSFDAPGRHRAPKLWESHADLHRATYANHRYLRMPSGPRVRPAQSQLSATAPKRAEAVSRIVSKTLRRLTGDRRFESISLQQRVSLSAASAFEGREPR